MTKPEREHKHEKGDCNAKQAAERRLPLENVELLPRLVFRHVGFRPRKGQMARRVNVIEHLKEQNALRKTKKKEK